MITKILVATILASVVVPSFVVRPVATSSHATTYATEAHGYNRLVANPSADVLRASDVTITVSARHVSRVIVDAPRVWTCGPMVELIQGSGSASMCEWRTVGGAR